MKKKIRSRLLDVLIVILCLSVFCCSIQFFWIDLNSASTRKDKEEIAEIEFKRKIAQRKFSDRVVWERLQQNSPLYDSDIIRTAEDAAATVTFKDGTVLELYESTMLQISYTKEGLQISVNDGNIELDTTSTNENKKVALYMQNGSVLKLDSGTKLSAGSNADTGTNSFRLQSGNATITTKSEEGVIVSSQTLTSGETINLNSEGKVSKEPLTVLSVLYETKLLAFNNEKTIPVKLEWTTSDSYNSKTIRIETSLTKDFNRIENTYSVSNTNSVTLQSPVGKLYWRIYPEGEKVRAAEGRIVVENVPKSVPLSPSRASVFDYRKPSELPKIFFSWTGNEYADHYIFEVSKSQDFSNTVISENLKATQFAVQNLEKGNYFWRITPFYKINSIGAGEVSFVNSFAIEQRTNTTSPKLSIPANNKTISFNADKTDNIAFQWKSEIKDAEYKILISDKDDFSTVVFEEVTRKKKISANFSLKTLPEGTYFWKVIRTSVEEEKPVESDTRVFQVEKNNPEITRLVFPPENYSFEKEKLSSIRFMWKVAEKNGSTPATSVIQFSKNKNFDTVIQEFSVDKQSFNFTNQELPTGSFYWRVCADNKYTAPRQFTILEPLAVPVFTSPSGDIVFFLSSDSTVKLSWTAVPGADYYKLKVYNSEEKLVNDVKPAKQSSVSLFLKPDVYKCVVQAFTEETLTSPGRSGKTGSISFICRPAEPVQLISPVNNEIIPGLKALRKAVVFTWKPGDKVEKSQFVLRKLQPNGTFKTLKTLENPERQIKVDRLEPGTYQWTIKASGVDGISLNGPVKTFVITKVPELDSSTLIFPVNGEIIDADYLKENRCINFKWSDVTGATEYNFEIYQEKEKGSREKIFEQTVYNDTEFRYENLADLDVGEFEWNITAGSFAVDGFEEQKGQTAGGNFKIQFKLPGKVQTIDPGKLYGE